MMCYSMKKVEPARPAAHHGVSEPPTGPLASRALGRAHGYPSTTILPLESSIDRYGPTNAASPGRQKLGSERGRQTCCHLLPFPAGRRYTARAEGEMREARK